MTNTQFDIRMEYLKKIAINTYKKHTPVDTGYQRDHIYAVNNNNGGFDIIIDTEYASYTMDKRTDGRNNPNEGWEKKASQEFLQLAEKILNKKP